MTGPITADWAALGWYIVLLLVCFLAGYAIGRRAGHAGGRLEGEAAAPLILKEQALSTGSCPVCGTAAVNPEDAAEDTEEESSGSHNGPAVSSGRGTGSGSGSVVFRRRLTESGKAKVVLRRRTTESGHARVVIRRRRGGGGNRVLLTHRRYTGREKNHPVLSRRRGVGR